MKFVKKITATAAVLCLVGVLVDRSVAFKPDRHTFGHTMIVESMLLNGYSYGPGMKLDIWATNLSSGDRVVFSKQAAIDVALGVRAVDYLASGQYTFDDGDSPSISPWMLFGETENPVAHCDNDEIIDCAKRIVDFKKDIVKKINNYLFTRSDRDLAVARVELGRALHTIHDFYAHSNYSDNNPVSGYFVELTGEAISRGDASDLSKRIISAESNACVARKNNSSNNENTWEKNGGNYLLVSDGINQKFVTTGYFDLGETASSEMGVVAADGVSGKGVRCDHGHEGVYIGDKWRDDATVSGIAKDAPYSPFSPGPFREKDLTDSPANASNASELHLRASYHAALHTRAFLDEVVAAINAQKGVSFSEKNDMIVALLGAEKTKPVNPIVGFVIDRTGSMGGIISGVQKQIQNLIDSSVTTNTDAQFLVTSYGDPDLGTPQVGPAAQAKSWVSAISAGGGGDCPELTYAGLKSALDVAPDRSKLFVFTDASAKDASRATEIKELAKSKQVAISIIASGTCSGTTDPTYADVTAATGGQVITTDHTSASVAAAFVGLSIDPPGFGSRPAAIAQGTLTGPGSTMEIPVDAAARALSVIGTFDAAELKLFDPSGKQVSMTGAGSTTSINNFIGGQGINVKSPAAGVWRATLVPTAASSAYSLNASVTSNFDLEKVNYFSPYETGRPGHEYSIPYFSKPPIGNVKVEFKMTDIEGLKVDKVELLSGEGATIPSESTRTTLSSSAGRPRALSGGAANTLVNIGRGYYSTYLNLPEGPFRLKISGTDASGQPFARVTSALTQPARFTVAYLDNPILVAGIKNSVRAEITNHGADGRFTMAADFMGKTADVVGGTSASIAKGASAVFDIGLDVPAGTDISQAAVLKTTISVDTDSRTSSVSLPILADSDGDGIPDVEESGAAGADPDYDGNGDGTPDRLQANVISFHSRQKSLYMTARIIGDGQFAGAQSQSKPSTIDTSFSFPGDLLTYKIKGLKAGASTKVEMALPSYYGASGYMWFKNLRPTKSSEGIDFVMADGTGATFEANRVTLTHVDGQRGDLDSVANGEIEFLGGPTQVSMRNVLSAAIPNPTPESGDSGGDGGCTMGRNGKDAGLPLLLAAAGALHFWRRRDRSRTKPSA